MQSRQMPLIQMNNSDPKASAQADTNSPLRNENGLDTKELFLGWGDSPVTYWPTFFFLFLVTVPVTAAMLVFQNNETAAMLVFQTNSLGVKLVPYVNVFFCCTTFA